jgi:hypothetical protein
MIAVRPICPYCVYTGARLGHGELFQDADGEWWIAALGFCCQDSVWPLRRETLLAKVEWLEGGWPKVEQPKMTFEAQSVRETAIIPRIEPVSDFVHPRGCTDAIAMFSWSAISCYKLASVPGHTRQRAWLTNLYWPEAVGVVRDSPCVD